MKILNRFIFLLFGNNQMHSQNFSRDGILILYLFLNKTCMGFALHFSHHNNELLLI